MAIAIYVSEQELTAEVLLGWCQHSSLWLPVFLLQSRMEFHTHGRLLSTGNLLQTLWVDRSTSNILGVTHKTQFSTLHLPVLARKWSSTKSAGRHRPPLLEPRQSNPRRSPPCRGGQYPWGNMHYDVVAANDGGWRMAGGK